MIELRNDAITMFQYIRAFDNSTTSHHRYSPIEPYEWLSEKKLPWNALKKPKEGFTQPWNFQHDRQVALVQLYNVTQGKYVCANKGKCLEPDTCICSDGWIGFDCRTPVCNQGYYEGEQKSFVLSENSTDTLDIFEPFLYNQSHYRLDPSGSGYSNPSFVKIEERFVTSRKVMRQSVKVGGQRYLHSSGFQGGYSCSIRSVTQWEDYRSGDIFEHPNFFSRYMDKKVEKDGEIYTFWKNMGFAPTHQKSGKLFLREDALLFKNNSDRIFSYTNEGYRKNGIWTRTDKSWSKGVCIVEFQRVCLDTKKEFDIQKSIYTSKPTTLGEMVIVQDTDLVSIRQA